jgi:hypothetical protein
MASPRVSRHACQRYEQRFGVRADRAAERIGWLWEHGETIEKGPGGFYRRQLVDGAVCVVKNDVVVTVTGTPIALVMGALEVRA